MKIAAALERDIRVIPILVEGAAMPRREELPEDLARLARRNALIVRHESFRSDADRLIAEIEAILHASIGHSGAVPTGLAEIGQAVHPLRCRRSRRPRLPRLGRRLVGPAIIVAVVLIVIVIIYVRTYRNVPEIWRNDSSRELQALTPRTETSDSGTRSEEFMIKAPWRLIV